MSARQREPKMILICGVVLLCPDAVRSTITHALLDAPIWKLNQQLPGVKLIYKHIANIKYNFRYHLLLFLYCPFSFHLSHFPLVSHASFISSDPLPLISLSLSLSPCLSDFLSSSLFLSSTASPSLSISLSDAIVFHPLALYPGILLFSVLDSYFPPGQNRKKTLSRCTYKIL